MQGQLQHIEGYIEAAKLVEMAITPRARAMRELERYVEGNQYAGRPDWFDETASLGERAPCIVDNVAEKAITSHSGLVLGQGRFPRVAVKRAPTDESVDGLSPEQGGTLDRFVGAAIDECNFEQLCREALDAAQGAGTAVVVLGVRDGELCGNTLKARWCEEPQFDASGAALSVDALYPYLKAERDARGRWKVNAYWFRRTIDALRDATYLPAPIRDERSTDPRMARWTEDPERTVAHGLGFCPVHWYPLLRGCATENHIDGHAIHARLLDEMTANDVALSQRHRAALYTGDPQWTEVGVEPGYNPGEAAGAGHDATVRGGMASSDNPVVGQYRDRPRTRGGERKKGPQRVWQYENPEARPELHVLPPGALDAISNHARDVRRILAEGLSWVPLEPESLKWASSLSGKSLNVLREREFDFCDRLRSDFGRRFIVPTLSLLLRIVYTVGSRGQGALTTPGIAAALPLLGRYAQGEKWRTPRWALHWGPYTGDDADDDLKRVQVAVQGKDGGLAPHRMAVQKVAPVFGIQDVDAALEEIETERAERQEEQLAMAEATKPEPKPNGARPPAKETTP